MKNDNKICEYVGIAAKHMALQGLSWWYNCYYESGHYSGERIGEGEMIIYYGGFTTPQDNHGRLTFIVEDKPVEEISIVCSWGVQGPGEHFRLEPGTLSSEPDKAEEQIRMAIEKIADYLRKVRMPVKP